VTSNRLVNEALEQARIQGRLSSPTRDEPGASLAKAPDVNAAYQEAQKATEPLQEPSPGPDTSRTSAAQQYDPIVALSSREQQQAAANPAPPTQTTPSKSGDLSQQYQERMEKVVQDTRTEQGVSGSQMIKEQQPVPRLNMDTPIGRAVDGQKFDQQWSKEQSQSKPYEDRMAKVVENARNEPAQDQQQDQGREMGRGQ
jgi:hypothetical protein